MRTLYLLVLLPALALAQGYQPAKPKLPANVSVSSIAASTSVQTPVINGPSGTARLSIPSNGTTTITSTVSDSGGAQTAIKLTNSSPLTNSSSNIWCGYSDNGTTSQLCLRKDGSLIPSTDATSNLGSTSNRFLGVYTSALVDASSNARITIGNTAGNFYTSNIANSASAVVHDFSSINTMSTAGALLMRLKNAGTIEASIDKDGGYTVAGSGNVTLQANSKICLDASCTLTVSGNGTGTVSLGNSPTFSGMAAVQIAKSSLGTCSSATEAQIRWDNGSGGTGTGHRTRVCACTSDGAASPSYAWRNLGSGTVGTSTTCVD